jgi:hypothetical protein
MRCAGVRAWALGAAHRMVPIQAGERERRAIQHPDNGRDVDLACRRTQGITPPPASTTGEQAGAGQLAQNGVQKTAWNALAGGNFSCKASFPLPGLSQVEERPKRVNCLTSHHQYTNAIGLVPNVRPELCQATVSRNDEAATEAGLGPAKAVRKRVWQPQNPARSPSQTCVPAPEWRPARATSWVQRRSPGAWPTA